MTYTPVFVLSPTFAARNDIQVRTTRFIEGNVPVTNLGLVRSYYVPHLLP